MRTNLRQRPVTRTRELARLVAVAIGLIIALPLAGGSSGAATRSAPASPAPVFPGSPQSAAEWLGRAEAAMAANPPNLQEALRFADAAIQEDDRLWAAHLVRGLALGRLGRNSQALTAFRRATALSPGQPAAHRAAAIAAFNEGLFDLAFENVVQAIQAGDTQAAGMIETMIASAPPPPDLDAQLEAARIFLAPIDTELYQESLNLAEMGGVSRRDPRLLEQPNQSETVLDFYELTRQMRLALVTSRAFGLVPTPDMARYAMIIEIHEIGGGVRVGGGLGDTPTRTGPRNVRGFVKIRDLRTDDEVYSRLLDLANMSSIADLFADMTRHVEFLEAWVAEENR